MQHAEVQEVPTEDRFDTGAVRDNESGKPDYTLVLIEPVLKRDVELLQKNMARFGRNNWLKGIPSSRCMRSICRHLIMYLCGHRGEDHLAAIRFNVACIMYNQAVHKDNPDINDLV